MKKLNWPFKRATTDLNTLEKIRGASATGSLLTREEVYARKQNGVWQVVHEKSSSLQDGPTESIVGSVPFQRDATVLLSREMAALKQRCIGNDWAYEEAKGPDSIGAVRKAIGTLQILAAMQLRA